MQSTIESIILFNEDGEKRVVNLKGGVNIISGESKTGKSALVEIIDYCLCSSRSTIPKGKITEFTSLFSLIIVMDYKRYLIARKNTYLETKKMLFTELSVGMNSNNLTLNFVLDNNFYDYKIIQKKIEKVLELEVSNIKDDSTSIKEAASLRHMTSYMFQHQNLMASKFALFYRFDDYQKKKDVMLQFPIFAGIVGQKYFSTLMLLNDYKKRQKVLLEKQLSNSKTKESIKEDFMPKLKNYFSLIGKKLDENISLSEMVSISKSLPILTEESYISDQIVIRHEELKKEIEKFRAQEQLLKNRLFKIEEASKNSNEYIFSLHKLEERSKLSLKSTQDYNCPLCGTECKDIHQIAEDIQEANTWLAQESDLIVSSTEHFSEENRKLTSEKDRIVREIKKRWAELRNIEKNYLSQNKQHNLEKQIMRSKIEIEFFLSNMDKKNHRDLDIELLEVQKKINECNAILGEFNLEVEIKIAVQQINKNMNLLKPRLDFEEEFEGYRLNFNVNEFEISLVSEDGEKVSLSEMGSGANWVSCHIALFLSLLRYFSSKKKKSPIPLIMFFDQPSQVYFPQDDTEDSKRLGNELEKDKQAVTNMYRVMFEEIEDIQKETGINPQLIVVDHVSANTMLNETDQRRFKESVREVWRNGSALI